MTHKDRQRRLFREALDLGVALAGADPRDFTSDAWGDGWGWGAWPVPPRYFQHQKKGELLPAYTSEAALRTLRDRSRVICAENEFALCALANRRNNVVGEGIQYRAVSDDAGLARAVQYVIDKWTDLVDLASVESEAMVRLDRDGEFILRTFEQSSGFLALRFQEPEHLRSPVGDGSAEYSYGVQTLPHDVGTKVGYWLLDDVPSAKPNFVPADEILHVTLNGDSNAKRGLPTFYPVEGLLRDAEDLLHSMAVQTKTQSKIAYIRRLNGVTAEGAEELQRSLTVATATDYRAPGGVRNVESLPPGSVLTASGNIDYEFPGIKVGASDGVAVLQAILRAVAARLVMPEWMLTVDASNANYSSSLIAEAPSTRQFLWLQRLFRQAFGESRRPGCPSLLWRQLGVCVRRGVLPPSVYRAVTVHAEAPSLVVRDKGQEAQVNKIYVQDLKIKSPETAAQEQGWDYAEEQGKIKKSANDPAGQAGQQQQQPFGAPGQGGQPGGQERPPATGIQGNPASEGGSEGADPFGISLLEGTVTGVDKLGRPYKYVGGKHVAVAQDSEEGQQIKAEHEAVSHYSHGRFKPEDAHHAGQAIRAKMEAMRADPHANMGQRQYMGQVKDFLPEGANVPPEVGKLHVFYDPSAGNESGGAAVFERKFDATGKQVGASVMKIGPGALEDRGSSGSLGDTYLHEVEHAVDAHHGRGMTEFTPRFRQMMREFVHGDEDPVRFLSSKYGWDHAEGYVSSWFDTHPGHELTAEELRTATEHLIAAAWQKYGRPQPPDRYPRPPTLSRESLAEAGFTGTVRDTKGREYHYVNGKRVARPQDAAAAPRRHSVDEVHEHVEKLLSRSEPVTPADLREVGNMLLTMSVADAHAVKRRLGLKASGRKEELALSIARKALGGANARKKAGLAATEPHAAPKPAGTPQESLANSPVKGRKKLGGGVNTTEIIELEDGTKGVWKPSDGEDHYLRDSIKGDYWRREVLASQLADALGLGDLVPPTVAREIGGVMGSVQQFAAGAATAAALEGGNVYDGPEDLARAAVLDFLTLNTDRHSGNWMLKGGKLVLIDNGLSFPDTNSITGYTHSDLLKEAMSRDLPVPEEVKEWAGKRAEVQRLLEDSGLSHKETALAMRRFDILTRAAGGPVRGLFKSGDVYVYELDDES